MAQLADKPVLMALIATLGTWGVTALGAALVFFFKEIKMSILNMMLGFASGVMIAASFWSLLEPSIEMAGEISSLPAWLVAAIGFVAGGAFLWLADKLMPHIHFDSKKGDEAEGLPSNLRRSILLVLSITLHNIPEGLAVGVAFGAVATGIEGVTIMGAVAVELELQFKISPKGQPSLSL